MRKLNNGLHICIAVCTFFVLLLDFSLTAQVYIVPSSGSQSFTTCNAAIIDHGGNGDYSNNSDGYTVIYPVNNTGVIHLEGNYDTESCCDHLYIYDGADITAPLLGQYEGTGHLDVTSTTGPITIRFVSDNSLTQSGFIFTVSCWGVCEHGGQPYGLSIIQGDDESFLVSWNPSPDTSIHNYIIEYGPSGFTPGTGTTVLVNSTWYEVTGLIPNDTYDFYIWYDCGEDGIVTDEVPAFISFCVPDAIACIDFTDWGNPAITCTYGTYDDPYATVGIIDNGSWSPLSRHTIHYLNEPDPRTGDSLMTIPPCEPYSVRLGNWSIGAEAESIAYDWLVDTADADILLLKYAAVLQNPHHEMDEQPRFDFEILDGDGNLIDPECGYASFIANADLGWNLGNGCLWKDWTYIGFDISAYHGQTIRIRMTVYDCSLGAHYGYAYFTLGCQRKIITASECGETSTHTFRAPSGFNYSWYYADEPDITISTDQFITMSTNDPRELHCHVSSLGNPNCCFDIHAPFGSRYPLASFEAESDSCGLTYTFHNTSTVFYNGDSTNTNNEPCESSHWDFGDGSTSNTHSPSHTFPDAGIYMVTLISGISHDACLDTFRVQLAVHDNCNIIYPDNVEDVDCTIDAIEQPWDAQVLHSVNDIHCYFVPLVGDIDGDGSTEIVAGKATSNDYNVTTIGIYRGSDLQQIGTITTPQPVHAGYGGPMALVRYPDGNGGWQGAVVLLCYDDKLRSYDIHGQLLATSDVNAPCTGAISITDFNYDGWPEVYIGNAVYDAATLKRLCAGPANGNMGLSWRCDNNQRGPMAMSFAANVMGDNFPELICGNTIYSVHIGSRTDVAQNNVNLLETITLPNSIPQDGNVAVADFNRDGQLDVLVTIDPTPNTILDTSYFYAYDPVTREILFAHRHYARTVGFPFVGDIDGDGFLEFVYLDYQSSVTNSRITAMQYRPGTGLQMQWQATHTDESGQTSMTLFDFNQDGIMEIVYRDQDRLRIINGSGRSHQTGNDTVPFYDLYSIGMTAGTWKEYPVVADVNNDGHAEIVTCGRMTTGLGFVGGQLVVVGGIHPWAPARKVWNQYMYNVTNINEDLTVPAPQFNNATVFTDPDNVVRRPFNNFLQQATTIDHYGRPFLAVPNATANSLDLQIVEDSVFITISYCNNGDNTLTAPYPVTIFANTYNGDIVATSTANENLPADSCTQTTISLPINTFCDILDLDSLVAAINCAGTGIAQNGGLQLECDTTDNTVGTAVSNQRDTTFITDTVCETYLWYDETLVQSGEYFHNNPDCSVNSLNLTVNNGTHIVTIASACESYTWSEGAGDTYTESGTYILEYTNAVGCPSADTLHLTVYSTAAELVETTVCKSDLPYHWNGVTFIEDGTQTAVLQTSHGCDSVITMTLNSVDNNIEVTLLTEDPCGEFEAELIAQTEMSNFIWSTGETTPQITVYQSGTYYVTVSDGICVATGHITVPACDCKLYLPNAITPTQENGINDYFFIPQHSHRQINTFEIIIYNRWGEMVFRSEDKNFRWHGDSNGKIMANTTYTYVIRWTNNNGKECMTKGIITVL
ncbi:MAG: gliding motility-associated C-terminal domain-containing protein [Bacteroidales bacterium]|nr:gliding motility-associated C-terminal domain-containing protein [Bacteroidales bacterium]